MNITWAQWLRIVTYCFDKRIERAFSGVYGMPQSSQNSSSQGSQ